MYKFSNWRPANTESPTDRETDRQTDRQIHELKRSWLLEYLQKD
jgi:hypothetical protein